MRKYEEYAEVLRIGEERRDASDNIKGFLYQDLLTIDLLLTSKDEDKIYVEWIEDIFVENLTEISIYQVKYYQKSKLEFQDIHDNMFFQYLKIMLCEKKKKNIKTYCLYHADETKEYDKNETKNKIKENDFTKIDKSDIYSRFEECSNFKARKKLLFNEVACTKFVDELNFKEVLKENIKDIAETLKETLYNRFEDLINYDSIFQVRNREDVENILLSMAVQYIQESYYKKPKDEGYKTRCMTKASFLEYMNKLFNIDKVKLAERIKFLIYSYIDDVFYEDMCNEIDLENKEVVEVYKEIYFSTKIFFDNNIVTSEQRFKFLNTISTQQYKKLNKEDYMKYLNMEYIRFSEHKTGIIKFIRVYWKILFNINCKDFGLYIKENEDCFFFYLPDEKEKPIIIIPSVDDPVRDGSKALSRVYNMKLKPRKWYFKGNYKGKHDYTLNVSKIKDARFNEEPNVFYKGQDDIFIVECMNCIRTDSGEMDKKDDEIHCLFETKCKEQI